LQANGFLPINRKRFFVIESPTRKQADTIVAPIVDTQDFDYAIPDPPRRTPRDWYKPIFDLTFIIAAHIALFPVMLALWTLIPLAIWLEDRGPVFYTQRRVGKNGKVFKLYKFRSMVVNAESRSGPVWASEQDPRITRVGRFIRARALDELPQIINIVRGDISLVGPRPERPEFIGRFANDVPNFLTRLQVRPGLTGVAQIFGRYASKPRDKLRYDVLYINRVSPWLDVKLILLSAWVTCLGRWQHQDKQLRGARKMARKDAPEPVRTPVESSRV
jgi:lipopolysaccharide/colanic/teichoic acid biosynthesis glycosyltransferase